MAAVETRSEVRAEARYVRAAPRKAQLVVDQIRGRTVPEARTILAFMTRDAARDVSKVLASAVANAEANHGLDSDELYVVSAYVGEGLANMRLGMTLEIATTIGGITGGLVAVLVAPSVISGVFAVMMVVTTVLVLRGREEHGEMDGTDDLETRDEPVELEADEVAVVGAPAVQGYETPGRLAGAYYDHHRAAMVPYEAERLGFGSSISFLAGALSGLLGVGGGFLKVPAMNLGMKVPIKVAAATSNFMIGVTAIASLFVYFARGYLHPLVAAPLAVGVVVGALVGARTSAHVSPDVLRRILAVVLLLVSVQMALNAFGVDFGR